MLNIKEIELNEQGKVVAMKGEIDNHRFRHHFSKLTLKIMFWSQFEVDYCGG